MEAVNGVSDGDKGAPPPPSPLTGCYLLIVVGEPHCNEHKDIILQRVAKGLLSWDLNDCLVDLGKELAIITEQALEGEEARYGERLIQFASENLVTEILIHPVVSTLAQCVRNLLSSFTRHRHIIHAGYTFANNGSWILQDGTFSSSDFSEAFQEIEVLRVIRAYENGISLDLHCAPEGDWTRLPKESFAKGCKVRVNPNDVLTAGSPAISSFISYLEPFLVPAELDNVLESSDVVGNIRFSRPTLYVFPGGQGDAALFGINGFNMLLDGGFSRKACFWDFVRHLDRLDAVLLTRLNNSNVNGISGVLRRKRQNALYPQIGHFFCNIQERKALLSPDGDKDKDPLLINLLDEGQEIVSNLRHLSLIPQVCYRDSEPINLYHKVGHGTLDMYVLSPAKDSKEVREFLQKWNNNDQKLFANHRTNKDFIFPLPNLVSICALLVWQPANPEDTITRILFPGSSPQNKIFEGLEKIKSLDFIKHPVCSEKSLAPATIIKAKQSVIERLIQPEKKIIDNKKEKIQKPPTDVIDSDLKNGDVNGDKVAPVKKSDSTESEKSISKPKRIIENGDKIEKSKPPKAKAEPRTKPRSESQQRKFKSADKKQSPTTPKKQAEKANDEQAKLKPKPSPTATPAKSAKEANNRKVVESKTKSTPLKKEPPKPAAEKKEVKAERKPISRRPKDISKLSGSPSKKVNGVQKPDSISRRGKLDKEGTTDSSTVSTPSAEQDSILKKDISKLTSDEIQNLKAQELADLKEEQEAVKEIEAVFRKGELREDKPSDFRKIKDMSLDDKLESEEYLIIEKTEIEQDLVNEANKEEETQKIARDSEESEKQRKLSEEKEEIAEKRMEIQDEVQKIITSATDIVKAKEETVEASKEVSVVSPEEKNDVSTDKKDIEEIKEIAQESQPDEKGSANIESGATTTAPTLPEDERMPLDEIKEDNGDQIIEEKHVKEDTKEKDVPVIQLPPKTFENVAKLPPVVGIRLDKQSHIRDIVKTPDEVADLPVHEEVEFDHFDEYPSATDTKSTPEEVKKDDDKIKDEKKEVEKVDEVKQIAAEEKTDVEVKKEEIEPGVKKQEAKEQEAKTVITEDLNKKELSKTPDEEKETDDHELEQQKEEIKEAEKITEIKETKPLEVVAPEEVKATSKDEKIDVAEKESKPAEIKPEESPEKEETAKTDEQKEDAAKVKEVIEKAETEVKEKDEPKEKEIVDEKSTLPQETGKLEELERELPDVPKEEIIVGATEEQKLKEEVCEIKKVDEKLHQLKEKITEMADTKVKTVEESVKPEKDEIKLKENAVTIEEIDEKLQKLKDDIEEKEIKAVSGIVTHKVEEPQHAEPVVITTDSLPDSPGTEEKLIEDKLDLGRKSPKEREEDVIKIVASVAEVLKSDAPLEEFEGKIPFSVPYKSYTTELRETHITTLESPVTDESKTVGEICPKTSSTYLIEEERKIAPIHEECEEEETRVSRMIKDSNELMQATTRMIQDIKLSQPKTDTIIEDPKEDQDADAGTVHRMLVTASSEDGGEEIEICPPGTITFSKSSESSGRSSPDVQSQKLSQKSSIADTCSDATVIIKGTGKDLEDGTGKVAEDSPKDAKDTKESVIDKALCDIEKVDVGKEVLDKVEQISEEKRDTKVEKKEEISVIVTQDEDSVDDQADVSKPDVTTKKESKDREEKDTDEKFEKEAHVEASESVKEKPEEKVEVASSEIAKIKGEEVAASKEEEKDKKSDAKSKEVAVELKEDLESVKEVIEEDNKSKDVGSVLEDTKVVDDGKKDEVKEEVASKESSTLLEETPVADDEKTDVVKEEPKPQAVTSLFGETKVVDDGKKDLTKEEVASKEVTSLLEETKLADDAKKDVIKDDLKPKDVTSALEETKKVDDGKKIEESIKPQAITEGAKEVDVDEEKDHIGKLPEENLKIDIPETKPSEITKEPEEKPLLFGGLVNDIGASLLDDTSNIIEDAQKQVQDIRDGAKSKTEEVMEDLSTKKEELVNDISSLTDSIEEAVETSKVKVDDVKDAVKTETDKLSSKAEEVAASSASKVEEIEEVAVKTKETPVETAKEMIEETKTKVDGVKQSVAEDKEKLEDAVQNLEEAVIKGAEVEITSAKEAAEKQIDDVEEAISEQKQTVVEAISDVKDTVSKEAEAKIEEIKKEVVEIQEAAKVQADDVRKSAEEKVDETFSDLQKVVDDGMEKTKEGVDKIETKSDEVKEKVVEQVESQLKDLEGKMRTVLEDAKVKEDSIKEIVVIETKKSADKLERIVELKDSLDSKLAEASSVKKDVAEDKPGEHKYDLYNGLETVEKLVVDVLTADREEVLPTPETSKKSDEKPVEAPAEGDENFVKTFVEETKGAISALFKRDSEEVLEKSALDLEENYEIVSDMAKSMVFEKCDTAEEHREKQEKLLEEAIQGIEKDFGVVSDMTQSIVFDKCEKLTEEEKEEKFLEKSAKNLEENYEVVSEMAQSMVFEKCEKPLTEVEKEEKVLEQSAKGLEENYKIVSDMAQSIVFDTMKDKSEEIPDASKTVESHKEEKEKAESVTSAIVEPVKDDIAKDSPAKSSGWSTPEKLDSKVIQEDLTKLSGPSSPALPADLLKEGSGKSTPDIKDLAKDLSGKSTPDIKDLAKDISGKSTPDIKDLTKDVSGKSTPDIKDLAKDVSGKSTPDIKEVDHIKVDNQDSLLSGKSSPGLSGKSSPVLSGRSTPGAKAESRDSLLSGKSTPDHTKPDSKECSLSGKSSPALSNELKSDEKEKPEKLTVDRDLADKSSPAESGKASPALHEDVKTGEADKSGKSTPEVKLQTGVKEEKEKSEKASPVLMGEVKNGEVDRSGKSTPEVKLETDVKDEKEKSGKASPVLMGEVKNGEVDRSGKSTPEVKLETNVKDEKEKSGKASPVLMGEVKNGEVDRSGKSTPEVKLEAGIKDEKEKSGKTSPALMGEVKNGEVDRSGKSTPEVKLETGVKDEKEKSGKTSPALMGEVKNGEVDRSGKSTPEVKLETGVKDEKEKSGKTSPALMGEVKNEEVDRSGKSTPEVKLETGVKDEKEKSGKTSSALIGEVKNEEVDRSGKSTPEVKLEKDVKDEKEKSDVTKDDLVGEKETDILVAESTESKLEKDKSDVKSEIPPSTDVKSDAVKCEIQETARSAEDTAEVKSAVSEKKTEPEKATKEELGKSSLETHSATEKKLSISDVQVSVKDPSGDKVVTSDLPKLESPEEIKQDDKTEARDMDSIDSGIDTEVDSKAKKSEESEKSSSLGEQVKGESTPLKSVEVKEESIAGPSAKLPDSSLSPKTSPEDLHLSGKSTPDIAEVEKLKEIEETLKLEKHIPGSSTPPTVPVSPIVKEISSIQSEDQKPTPALKSVKDTDIRSCTPGSDDYEIGASTHSDISSGQVSRAPHLLESERIESDDEDDVPGSPMSVTSQVAHSRSSSRYDFEDDRIGTKLDPMNTSFYGALPDEEDTELDFDKALAEHRQTRGHDLVSAEESPSYLYEVTTAKFSAKTPEPETLTGQSQLDQINKNGTGDVMTASFMGDLPTSSDKKDVLESWGKPLGLPSPAPPTDNRGTPKKERKLPSNVSAKNKLNDDKKRAESPSKYKNKKFNPVYVDLTYVPHHGNSYYSYVDFFKRVRARYYVFSGIEPSREVYNALLEAKQTWDDKELEVTIIPTYDTDILGYWVAENEELLTKYKIDLSPSASRCTINLQDHETSCSAYRLEF